MTREMDALDWIAIGAFGAGVIFIGAVLVGAAMKQKTGFISDDLYRKAEPGTLTQAFPYTSNGVL